MLNRCPVCGGGALEVLYPEHTGACITSDLAVLPDAAVANRTCTGCGLVFNAAGTRGDTKRFYEEAYNLMLRSREAQLMNFAQGRGVSQAQRTCDILHELVRLPDTGRLLEAGAGKGDFLQCFAATRPEWSLSAFEPSRAWEMLAERLPAVKPRQCTYRDYDGPQSAVDLVVALGVLEHVEDPLDMLGWAASVLREGGWCYIRVPNFARNPNDLFCADHLSKLTVPMLRVLAEAVGFEWVAHREAGVPVFVVLRKTRAAGPLGSAYADSRLTAERNVAVARAAIEAVLSARREAGSCGERFGIFGLGASGLFAPLLAGFDPSEITAYVDENPSVHGATVHGRPVVGLEGVRSLGMRHVALAVSPVYVEQVTAKLRPYGVKVHAAVAESSG